MLGKEGGRGIIGVNGRVVNEERRIKFSVRTLLFWEYIRLGKGRGVLWKLSGVGERSIARGSKNINKRS